MPTEWEPFSGPLQSLLEGTLHQNIRKYEDFQLRPFLPVLIKNCFDCKDLEINAALFGRISSFTEANNILEYLKADYTEIEIDFKSPKHSNSDHFDSLNFETKMKLLLYSLFIQESREDKFLQAAVSDDSIDSAILTLQIAYLKLPHLFNLEKLVTKAISVPKGSKLVAGLIFNAPELLDPILTIIKGIQVSDESGRGRERASILDWIFDLYPDIARSVVDELAQNRRDALLSIRLACMHVHDDTKFLQFLCSQLIHRDGDTLVSQHIAKNIGKPTLDRIYDRLIKINKAIMKTNPSHPLTEVIRLFAYLQGHCMAKLTTEQHNILLGLVCRKVGDDQHLVFTVAVLLSLQSITLTLNQGVLTAIDSKVTSHFQWLRDVVRDNSRPDLTSNLLYIASCVYSNKRDLLNAMFAELLRIQIIIQPRHLEALSSLLQDNFFKAEEVAVMCTNLPVTQNLNANSGSRLTLHTIYLCFVKHGIDIAAWLEAQIRVCSLPIHNILPELIERFAMMATRSNLPGLSKQFIDETFTGGILDEKTITRRMLTFLFLLSYRSNLDQLGSKAFEIHGPDVYSKLPARYLLSIAMSRTKDFAPIQSALTRLSTDICPYMLPTVDSVFAVKNVAKRTIPLKESAEELMKQLETRSALGSVVKKIQYAPISDQLSCIKVITQAFVITLDGKSSVPVMNAIFSLYKSIANFAPRFLYESSAIEWLGGHAISLLLTDIYEHPSLLFRSDRRIFYSPGHFRCFITALNFFMKTSKNNLLRKIHTANIFSKSDQDRQEKEALSIAFDNTQSSLIVQLLIEISDERRMKDDLNDEAISLRRKKIRSAACEFIHQMFISDPQVLKLVLFQGIHIHMLQWLVEEIPSMYVAIDHLQEMLAYPDMNRRVLAVCLMVALARKYRVFKSFDMSDFILNNLHTLLKYSESYPNMKLFLKIVPSVAELISIFPQMAGDVTSMLLKVSAMAKSRLVLKPLIINPNSEERQLISLIHKTLSEQVEAQVW